MHAQTCSHRLCAHQHRPGNPESILSFREYKKLTDAFWGVQSALRLKPTFTDAYNNLASALVQKGLVPAALQCYQAALQINPHLVLPSLAPFLSSWQIGSGQMAGQV